MLNPFVLIQAENLTKTFGGLKALDDLSWEIQPGQIVAVLGANGAGKTTLLNALTGSIVLDQGQVSFDGQALTPARADVRRRFAFLPDVPPVSPSWTPIRLIGSMLKLYQRQDADADSRACALLEKLDLLSVARWSFRQLSRGQIYKAALAAFILADPETWFIDEPFASGMDPRGLNCFKQYARQAAERGHTIIFTTQIVEVAQQLAHRVCVLDKGRIRADLEASKLQETGSDLALLLADLLEGKSS